MAGQVQARPLNVKCYDGWLIGLEVVTGGLYIACGHSQTSKNTLVEKVYGFCYKVCRSSCM